MTLLVIMNQREALLSKLAHVELLQSFLLLFVHVKNNLDAASKYKTKNGAMEQITPLY